MRRFVGVLLVQALVVLASVIAPLHVHLRGDDHPSHEHAPALHEHGGPRVLAPTSAAKGLRFLGFLARPSALGHTARLSRRMAKQIAAELRS